MLQARPDDLGRRLSGINELIATLQIVEVECCFGVAASCICGSEVHILVIDVNLLHGLPLLDFPPVLLEHFSHLIDFGVLDRANSAPALGLRAASAFTGEAAAEASVY